TLAVSAEEHWGKVKHLVADHPLHAYAETFSLDLMHQNPEFLRLFQSIPHAELDYRALSVIQTMFEAAPQMRKTYLYPLRHIDPLYHDYAMLLRATVEGTRWHWAERLLAFSPYCPLGRSVLIEGEWSRARDKAALWEKEVEHPAILLMLGKRYFMEEKIDDAERCLQRSIALSPDAASYRVLAGAYQTWGKPDKWLATLE